MAVDFENFDWRSIAGAVAPFAPKIGGLLGSAFGPFGSIAGTIAGNALAATFNTTATPAAVGRAIAEDPAAADKLRQLEARQADALIAQAQVQIEALKQAGLTDRTSVTQINQTIREESATVSWWHWRHLLGYLVGLYGLQQIILLWVAAFFPTRITPADAALLFNATTVFTAGLFGLLGFVANDTTNLKQTAITGERGSSLLASVKSSLTGRPSRS